MFAFTFEQEIIQEQPHKKLDQISLIQALFMTILENQRLRHELSNKQDIDEVSFCIDKKNDFNREQEYKLEIQLKQVKIDNMNAMIKQLQYQIVNNDKQMQEIIHRNSMLEMSLRQENSQLKSQTNYYKNKYEEQANSLKKYSKLQLEYKNCKIQLQLKNKELNTKVAQQEKQLSKIEKHHQLIISDYQKRNKQLRSNAQTLRNDLSLKQQQCFSLKATLNDCPKLEQLNRWISKVKEYDEKQMQACGKMSQMSQQLCVSRQRYRKLQNQYRQLQKIKQQLQGALTENKGNQDSMVIYFDRLETYEKVIKELEEEIRKLEQENKNKDKQYQMKIQNLQRQKESTVTQWKTIVQEMNKQKNILISMQKEVEKYQKHIANQNQRQNQLIKNQQNNQLNFQMRLVQQERNKNQQIPYQPYSFVQSSKCSEKSNRSISLQTKKSEFKSSQIQTQTTNGIQSQVSYQQSSRQQKANSIGRVTSQRGLIYHSDPQSRNSTSRLNTQNSNVSYRQTGCGECISRVQQNRNDYSNRSMLGLQQNRYLRNEECRAEIAQITDQKKLLMQKLNILKPQDPNVNSRGIDRNISNLYSKNYRQVNQTSKLTTANSSKQLAYQIHSSNRLQIARGKPSQQKQNINDMIAKRYVNLLQRN